MAATKKVKQQSFRVVGLAEAVNQSDVEVSIKAESASKARDEAIKLPEFANFKQVRVYCKVTRWVRVS